MTNGGAGGQRDGDGATPFGLDLSPDVISRATRLAGALFGGVDAGVILWQGDQLWRSDETTGPRALSAAFAGVVTRAELVWSEDLPSDPRFADHPNVAGPPHYRYCVMAPLRLADGTVPGVLYIAGPHPRPFDAELAARLSDLADFVADDWARAQARHDREASVRELDAARATLSTVVEAAPMSLLLVDRDMRILAASSRWAADYGLTGKPMVGQLAGELSSEFLRWEPALRRALAGEPLHLDRVRLQRNDGQWSWVQVEVTAWRDADGAVGGLIIAGHDITAMVDALERSERAEERLHLALGIAKMHVWEIDFVREELFKAGADVHFFPVPKTYADFHRDANETLKGSVDPRDHAVVAEAWERHAKDGAPYYCEYRLPRDDGREFWVACCLRLIRNEKGRATRLIGALQDISGRKASEAALLHAKEDAEAANRAKSTFLATMSHEIRTPLNGVLGMAQAMAADELSEVQCERLDVIHQSGQALLAILNDVLDLSKIEAGKLELEEADFDVCELARGAHAAFTAIAHQKGLSFDLQIDPSAHGLYRGDSTRVRQILYNLISNALKFTDAGCVQVKLLRADSVLRLTVRDTGIGIAPERLATLFEKFEQADASTTRRFGGTGLGLAICRDLVHLMGGTIAGDSKMGEGAAFTVNLPLRRIGAAPGAKASAAPVEAAACDLRPLRLLAAEDNAVNQLVLKTLLHQVGVDLLVVDDGQAAVEAWAREPFDVILMDVHMPRMDGPTATAAIRAREAAEGRPRTPIVALTANAMSHQVAEYLDAGMDSFIAKPIEVSRLLAVLQEVLERQSPDAAAVGALRPATKA